MSGSSLFVDVETRKKGRLYALRASSNSSRTEYMRNASLAAAPQFRQSREISTIYASGLIS